jgi:hypothetical protein
MWVVLQKTEGWKEVTGGRKGVEGNCPSLRKKDRLPHFTIAGIITTMTNIDLPSMKEKRKEGRKEGREEGRKRGRKEERKEGREEGRKRERKEERTEGREEGRKDGRK